MFVARAKLKWNWDFSVELAGYYYLGILKNFNRLLGILRIVVRTRGVEKF